MSSTSTSCIPPRVRPPPQSTLHQSTTTALPHPRIYIRPPPRSHPISISLQVPHPTLDLHGLTIKQIPLPLLTHFLSIAPPSPSIIDLLSIRPITKTNEMYNKWFSSTVKRTIITGRGVHSDNGSILGPFIRKYLTDYKIRFVSFKEKKGLFEIIIKPNFQYPNQVDGNNNTISSNSNTNVFEGLNYTKVVLQSPLRNQTKQQQNLGTAMVYAPNWFNSNSNSTRKQGTHHYFEDSLRPSDVHKIQTNYSNSLSESIKLASESKRARKKEEYEVGKALMIDDDDVRNERNRKEEEELAFIIDSSKQQHEHDEGLRTLTGRSDSMVCEEEAKYKERIDKAMLRSLEDDDFQSQRAVLMSDGDGHDGENDDDDDLEKAIQKAIQLSLLESEAKAAEVDVERDDDDDDTYVSMDSSCLFDERTRRFEDDDDFTEQNMYSSKSGNNNPRMDQHKPTQSQVQVRTQVEVPSPPRKVPIPKQMSWIKCKSDTNFEYSDEVGFYLDGGYGDEEDISYSDYNEIIDSKKWKMMK